MNREKLQNIFTKIGEVNPKYNLKKHVYKNGKLIQFIDNPSEEVGLAVVSRDPFSIKYIQNPSEEVQLVAVKKNGFSIHYIQNPSEKVRLAAVRKNAYSIRFIQNPSERVKQLVRSKGYNI